MYVFGGMVVSFWIGWIVWLESLKGSLQYYHELDIFSENFVMNALASGLVILIALIIRSWFDKRIRRKRISRIDAFTQTSKHLERIKSDIMKYPLIQNSILLIDPTSNDLKHIFDAITSLPVLSPQLFLHELDHVDIELKSLNDILVLIITLRADQVASCKRVDLINTNGDAFKSIIEPFKLPIMQL